MADPAYIVDGVLTDGEAWVGVASATITGAGTATVTFTSTDDGQVGDFSQYMDLVLISYGDTATSSYTGKMTLNNDTGSNYAYQRLYGSGTSASAASSTQAYFNFLNYNGLSNDMSCSVTHLFDINSGKYKSALISVASDMDGGGQVELTAATWQNQSPISEIDLDDYSGNDWETGSMFSLFGVLPRMVA